MINTVRGRLTLWYVSVLALVLATFSVILYALMSRSLYERMDSGLRSIIEVSTRSLTNDTEEGARRIEESRSSCSRGRTDLSALRSVTAKPWALPLH